MKALIPFEVIEKFEAREALESWLGGGTYTADDYCLVIGRNGWSEYPSEWLKLRPKDETIKTALWIIPGGDWDAGGAYAEIAETDGAEAAVECLIDVIVEQIMRGEFNATDGIRNVYVESLDDEWAELEMTDEEWSIWRESVEDELAEQISREYPDAIVNVCTETEMREEYGVTKGIKRRGVFPDIDLYIPCDIRQTARHSDAYCAAAGHADEAILRARQSE